MKSFRLSGKKAACYSSILFLITAALWSCGDQTKKSSAQLDRSSEDQLKQIRFALSSSNIISPANYNTIKGLYQAYPANPEVVTVYRSALIIRDDYPLLIESYLSTPTGSRTRDDNINLAKAYLKLGRADDALKVVYPLADGTNNDPELNSLLGKANYIAGNYRSAAEHLDASWATYINNKQIDEITTRGLVYYHSREYDKCIATMLQSLEFDPNNKAAANLLSRAYSEIDDAANAAKYSELSIAIQDRASREETNAIKFTSRIYDLQDAWSSKKYNDVVSIARELIPVSPRDKQVVLYQYLVESYKALGNAAESERAAEELRKLGAK